MPSSAGKPVTRSRADPNKCIRRLQELRVEVAQRSRQALRRTFNEQADEWVPEEIQSHFASMPLRYWLRVDAEACRWHLSTVHAFFKQVAEAQVTTTSPVVRWRVLPGGELTEVAVCSWDRPGLLMNIAGALARAGFDIFRASVYTRADHLALDLFEVRETGERRGLHDTRLRYAGRLLGGAMTAPLAILSSGMAAASALEVVSPAAQASAAEVVIENHASADHTLVRIDAANRFGLLFHILDAFVRSGVNVQQATIVTVHGRARDSFEVTENRGGRIESQESTTTLREALLEALRSSTSTVPEAWCADPLQIVAGDSEPRLA